MKNKYLFPVVISTIFFGQYCSGQDQLSRDFAPIKTQLQEWDPVRGEWLAESMLAIAKKQPVPDRTFPEDFTPSEMIKMVPASSRENIQNTINANRTAQGSGLNGEAWNQMSDFVQRTNCKMVSGRSYGDPHLSSFDGKAFSFQTVGEFILVQSGNRNVQVQTRQKASGEDFSLNTAVAMNVAGDRVCIYADEKPDSDLSNPVRVDGRSVLVKDRTYYLEHGGTIRNNGNEYVVTWPTGEKVSAQITKNSKFDFINVTTHIYPCISGGYEGLLGNANGSSADDINTRNNRYDYETANRFNTVFGGRDVSMSNEAEKEYLVYLAKEFGSAWRVDRTTTLFDYGPNQSTEYFTDFSFPRYHRTVRDLSQTQRDNARRDCENRGIRGSELEGCIFDRAYVNIEPNPRPVLRDPTEGAVLTSIDRGSRVRNINPPGTDGRDRTTDPRGGGNVTTPVSTTKPVGVSSDPVNSGTVVGTKKPVGIDNPGTVTPVETKETKKPNVISAPVIEDKPVVRPKENKAVTPIIKEPVPTTQPATIKETRPMKTIEPTITRPTEVKKPAVVTPQVVTPTPKASPAPVIAPMKPTIKIRN